jgi:ribosomal protein S18 acetylase RimI-like enzyme
LALRELRDEPDDVALGTELVLEYVIATAEETGIDVDLILPLVPDLHDFAARYLRGGTYLVADAPDHVAGGVGVAPLAGGVCEMNRLWVRPDDRRDGVGRALAVAAIDAGRRLGFARMILDVVPERTGALTLYRGLGFTDAPPAHDYPFPMVFLGRDL